MYLEISGKQTGKTTRLVEAVKKWLDESENHKAIIVSPKVISGHFVMDNFDREYFPRLLASYKMTDLPVETDNLKWFVDDFNEIDEDKLEIKKDGYYVTSLGESTNPFVDKILKANKSKFTEF